MPRPTLESRAYSDEEIEDITRQLIEETIQLRIELTNGLCCDKSAWKRARKLTRSVAELGKQYRHMTCNPFPKPAGQGTVAGYI